MSSSRSRTLLVLCMLIGLLAVPVASARAVDPVEPAPAPTAFDYSAVDGLSQPSDVPIVRTTELVEAFDGIGLYVEVTRPDGPGPYPVILEASPYHGTLADREGTRILPEPRDEEGNSLGLTGYFAPRGYAIVMMDLRGTGRSEGCLDHIGPNDVADLGTVIEWAASQAWSNGRVGMAGHSYVGGTQAAAAALDPEDREGLVTIVPSAGLASMYHHQFQGGVPYFLQWAGPMAAYEQIAIERHLPGGDNFGNGMEYFGCGLPQSSLTAGEAQLSGAYTDWHAERDWTAGATAADIPVFMVHGVNDNAARVAAIDWFTARRAAGTGADDKLWLGQWDHGSGCCPTRRGLQWTFALHGWYDRWLAERPVDTGPAREIFLSDGSFEGARSGDRSEILLLDSQWPGAPSELAFFPTADGGLAEGAASAEEGEVSFAGDPFGFEDPQGTGAAEFATDAFDRDLYLAGVPELDLAVSVSTPRVHLITTLYDENPDGDRRRITQFAINPELRDGLDSPSPASPGERYQLALEGFAMGHHLRPGHQLVLRVTTSDPDKVPTFAVDPNITVFTGGDQGTAVRVPVVGSPVAVADDVPLFPSGDVPVGPAQPPVSGSVVPILPGAGVRVGTLTSGYLEFDVEEGFDNARLLVEATPSSAADIDLFLQQQLPDESWSDDLAAAESSSTSGELLSYPQRLEPGHYRIEAHNWLGAPFTSVDLVITFFNQEDVPGTA